MPTAYTIFSKLIRPLVGSGIGNNHIIADLYQRIMLRLLPETEKIVEVQGFKMKVLMKGHINDIATELLFRGVHEPATTRIFKKILNTGDIVVDVGANIGYFTLLAAQLVGWKGKVFAFEPALDNIKALRENIELNKLENVRTFPVALGSYNSSDFETLYTCSREPARHSLVRTKEHDGKELVAVTTLDNILAVDMQQVRLLKTDTEGNELAVLRGARQTILSSKDIVLIVEVNFEALKACGPTIEKLLWDCIIHDLDMNWIWLLDDYRDNIELIYSPGIYKYNWIDKIKPRGKAVLGYNLLCSREEIEL